jgi:CheY-like chemotaxis protein
MKRVLDIGQCAADHGAIAALLRRQFDADVAAADDLDDAMGQLRGGGFDLVLVNRKLDADASDGLAVIRGIKADPELASIPVMLVSNYPEYHQQAAADGAEIGFGKAELAAESTRQRLEKFLG